jgi:mannose-6-phosphate isomerase-like protein (cupin superfamily)
MKLLFFVIATCAACIAAEQDPAGYAQWKSGELKSFEKKLAPKMNEFKVASDTLAKFGNHSVMVAHREANGQAELHQKQADVFFVQSGEATLVVGGTVVDPKNSSPNEILGSAIKDGVRKRLAAGDVVHIPPKTAHQLMVEPGKQFTYAIIKIDSN